MWGKFPFMMAIAIFVVTTDCPVSFSRWSTVISEPIIITWCNFINFLHKKTLRGRAIKLSQGKFFCHAKLKPCITSTLWAVHILTSYNQQIFLLKQRKFCQRIIFQKWKVLCKICNLKFTRETAEWLCILGTTLMIFVSKWTIFFHLTIFFLCWD